MKIGKNFLKLYHNKLHAKGGFILLDSANLWMLGYEIRFDNIIQKYVQHKQEHANAAENVELRMASLSA